MQIIISRLVWTVIRGASVESGGRVRDWFQQTSSSLEEMISLLLEMFQDSSSITVRQSLAGVRECLPVLLQSDSSRECVKVLEQLSSAVTNNYWLVRCDLCQLITDISLSAADYLTSSWSTTAQLMLTRLLSDEDSRVRSAAASALVQVILISHWLIHNKTHL